MSRPAQHAAAVLACAGLFACGLAELDRNDRLEKRLAAAVAARLAPVARPTGVPASLPCPERELVDGRPDPVCRTAALEESELWTLGPAMRESAAKDDPDALRLQGLWALALDAPDRALVSFTAALDRDPSPARHNDVAAALILRAARAGDPADLGAALEHAARAVVDPRLGEARVNHAFALTSLGLRRTADRAWQAAEEHGEQRVARAYRGWPPFRDAGSRRSDRARGETLLGLWALHRLSGKAIAAEAALEEARRLAAAVAARGDTTLLEAVEIVLASDPARRHALERGHAALHQLRGDKPYSDCELGKLEGAGRALAEAGSPFAAWVQIDLAVCSYFAGDYPSASRRLHQSLARWAAPTRSAVTARAHALLALVAMLQGRYAEADSHFAEAIARCERLGETGEALYQQAVRARNLAFGGLHREAWEMRLPALLGLEIVPDRERAVAILQDAVLALRREGNTWAALAAVEEQIAVAEEAASAPGGEPDLAAYVRIERATLLSQLGRLAEAATELDRAEADWQRLPPTQEIRDTIANELAVARAGLAGGPVAAIDQALTHYTARASGGPGNRLHIVRLLRLRADLGLRAGSISEAARDLERGIAEVEEQRTRLDSPEQRARFAAQARDLVTSLVRLEIDERQDPYRALVALDKGAGRLAFRGEVAAASSMAPATLAGAVPRNGRILRWGHLADRVLIWSVDGAGTVRFEQRPVAAEVLHRLIAGFRDAVRAGAAAEEHQRLGRRLAELTLPRDLEHVADGAALLLIPDAALQEIPFAALPHPRGSYLAAQHPLSFAPNLETLLRPLPPRRPSVAHEVLVVADPELDSVRYPGFPRLLHAARPPVTARATLLAGKAATRRAVLKALPNHRILYAAAHGLTDATSPSRGGLLLAADPADPQGGLLTAAHLSSSDLGGIELVMLASCSTGLGTVPTTSDYAGLAAALLAGGVPAVLSAAWPIDDAASGRFFASLFDRLLDGASPLEALHATQVASLRSATPLDASPRSWAAFQLHQLGGHAAETPLARPSLDTSRADPRIATREPSTKEDGP